MYAIFVKAYHSIIFCNMLLISILYIYSVKH